MIQDKVLEPCSVPLLSRTYHPGFDGRQLAEDDTSLPAAVQPFFISPVVLAESEVRYPFDDHKVVMRGILEDCVGRLR